MHELETSRELELIDIRSANGSARVNGSAPEPFAQRLRREAIDLRRDRLDVLQINVGKLCNQACHHCHVDAGPARTEIMSRETMDGIVRFLSGSDIPTVDITGGAPEVNPHFRHLVEGLKALGRHLIVRCNLTVILEPGQEGLPEFYKAHEVELVCSMPCYQKDNVDQQRGRGVFDKSIRALQILNGIGYGRPGTGLILHLVYNPVGAILPAPQDELEADYKEALQADHGIVFNRLYTITNMPIHRFSEYLKRRGEYDDYMDTIRESFNPATVGTLMCRSQVSVDWNGYIYDCDFNQMLEIHLTGKPQPIWETTVDDLVDRRIRVRDHCYGCTAGAGSSCGGALT